MPKPSLIIGDGNVLSSIGDLAKSDRALRAHALRALRTHALMEPKT